MSLKWTEQHFWALDLAMNRGLTIGIKGKSYVFSPLKLKHLAELIALARSDALKAWRLANQDSPVDPSQIRTRNMEMNVILFGAMGQSVLDLMGFPLVRRRMLELSLSQKHPNLPEEFLDSFFDDEETVMHVAEAVLSSSVGPVKETEGKSNEENPPGPPIPSATTSVP